MGSLRSMDVYAVLGPTGNCGTPLIQNLLTQTSTKINAYCRNKSKLLRLISEVKDRKQVYVFEGSIKEALLKHCLKGSRAAFLIVFTNDNIPGRHLGQDTATSVFHALEGLKQTEVLKMPQLVLLSSATINDHF
ncbi:hypothetical protein NHQ30_003117 [Ciborinia camelliae]|nr:hypothetical protein NHQ30_003117 [Ciborinia camelliae]